MTREDEAVPIALGNVVGLSVAETAAPTGLHDLPKRRRIVGPPEAPHGVPVGAELGDLDARLERMTGASRSTILQAVNRQVAQNSG